MEGEEAGVDLGKYMDEPESSGEGSASELKRVDAVENVQSK